MMQIDKKIMQREILVAFWKIHILHHAASGPVVGQWMLTELRRHGYEVSPGTMYPLLARLEGHGWLSCSTVSREGTSNRKEYHLTASGREALVFLRRQVGELHHELAETDEEEDLR